MQHFIMLVELRHNGDECSCFSLTCQALYLDQMISCPLNFFLTICLLLWLPSPSYFGCPTSASPVTPFLQQFAYGGLEGGSRRVER